MYNNTPSSGDDGECDEDPEGMFEDRTGGMQKLQRGYAKTAEGACRNCVS
jgi:hypothetical protein